MTIKIRSASVDDASALSLFGATTFRDTFEKENSSQDMERYLAEAFTPDQQATEIADAAGAVLLAEHISESGDAELVGYAHLVPGDAPEAVRGAAPLELKRLYVARAWHGRRVAQRLMEAAIDAARARGAQTLWLGVWERNPRAAAFYAKYGFARVGEHTFVLGGDAQTDWIFARPVEEG
jgi:GNAT superfamily N-acetyltransferase